MAMSPVSGALSPTQLAVLAQIRALRAVKPPMQAVAPAQPAPPAAAKPVPASVAASDRPQPNLARGSILNISV
ncbi:MAG TPA: hypothetical protein VNF99_17235 [Stellaceae bacterium]|nr:hypothetical protein [Stellaceae bacterium]